MKMHVKFNNNKISYENYDEIGRERGWREEDGEVIQTLCINNIDSLCEDVV